MEHTDIKSVSGDLTSESFCCLASVYAFVTVDKNAMCSKLIRPQMASVFNDCVVESNCWQDIHFVIFICFAFHAASSMAELIKIEHNINTR